MRVLYATDGLPAAWKAMELIESVADRNRVEVTVLSVTHAGLPAPEHLPYILDALEGRRAQTTEIVDAAVERLLSGAFAATGHTGEGSPGREIVHAVEREWYDMTVLGAGSASWLGNLLLGSTSTYVLHSSPSSVLIVRAVSSAGGKCRVLVGVDGSRGSNRAVHWLSAFADPERCEMSVLSVAPTIELVFPPSPVAAGPPLDPRQVEEIEHRLVRRADRHAESAATRLRDAGFATQSLAASGHPTVQLLTEAEKGNYDLVAVGSRGAGPFRRALLGSVSDQVARSCAASFVARRSHAPST